MIRAQCRTSTVAATSRVKKKQKSVKELAAEKAIEEEAKQTARVGSVANGTSIEPCPRTIDAAIILKSSRSHSTMTTAKAMRYAGFSEEESKNTAFQRRVHRHKKFLILQDQQPSLPAPTPAAPVLATPPPAPPVSVVAGVQGGTDISPLSLSTSIDFNNTNNKRKPTALTTIEVEQLAEAAVALAEGTTDVSAAVTPSITKRRRTAKQKQYDMARNQEEQRRIDHGYTVAYSMLEEQKELPTSNRLSAKKVCDLVNNLHGTNISYITLLRRVRKGIGHVPPRAGRKPTLPPALEASLVNAISTFITLRCAEMKQQPNRKDLLERLSMCCKDAPTVLTDYVSLFRRLEQRYAKDVVVDTADSKIEERRALWGTFNHINDWFDTQKQWFIDHKFARPPSDEEIAAGFEGELFFYPGQLDRILNLDETGISLDGTSQMAGGRPVTRYGPGNKRLPTGVSRANKSGYKCTFIGGSTVAGDPLPPHFQLKCTAKDEADRKISADFLQRKTIPEFYGRFGFEKRTGRGLTFNSNPTAGMDSVEFKKYMETAIIPLYPDAKDVDGKRVCVMVDSGPGRMSESFLSSMRKEGFHIVVTVPNTTHIMQPTDKSYGLFKSIYRENLKELTIWRRRRRQSVRPADIMVLIFGGSLDHKTKLRHCFHEAFDVEKSKQVWADVGLFPFTRKCLDDTKVTHELIILPDGSIDVDADPLTFELLELEKKNSTAVEYLNGMGFDGELFRQAAPRNYQKMRRKMTTANTRERQDEIEKANTSGQLYIATKGLAVNSNDFFLAKERSRRKIAIADMRAKKKKAASDTKKRDTAVALIAKCEEDNKDVTQLSVASLRVVLEWKTGKKTTPFKKKVDLIDLWNSIKDDPPCSSVEWTEDEEQLLKELETKEIEMKDTLLGKEVGEMVEKNLSYLGSFSDEQANIADVSESRLEMMKKIQQYAAKLMKEEADKEASEQGAELMGV